MTGLLVRPEAEMDIFEAASWYEREQEGLGVRFVSRVRPLVTADIRRALLGQYPFGVFFFIDDRAPTVLAVMHLQRNPSIWKTRR
jgi:hypothetical protein